MPECDVVIIGAGPAGLTAAYELLKRSKLKVVVLESEGFAGGISRTFESNGNRMDMGGHRFFSKSDKIMDWWLGMLPLQGSPSKDDILLGRSPELGSLPGAPDPEQADRCMLVRSRLSRIYFLRRFFKYPVSLGLDTVMGLGLARMAKIGFSYLWASAFPRKQERTLEDFMVNRFGLELYKTFFRDYTEKVWGVPCKEIPAEWGAQRIKGISIAKVLKQAWDSAFKRGSRSLRDKSGETSLIEQFIYPKLGPGQLWEEVARQVVAQGGEIRFGCRVSGIKLENGAIAGLEATCVDGSKESFKAGSVISSMPLRELVAAIEGDVPASAAEVAAGLQYRDFRTVGLLVKRLRIKNSTGIKALDGLVPDTWIYIQERDVKLGRLQIFNNWSPYLVKDWSRYAWLGLEYFCNEGDAIWNMPDDEMALFAACELAKIGVIDEADVMESCSVKVPKAYPAYFGSYSRFSELRAFLDGIANLYPVGRNGMHRYNNMDHSMLTAMAAVDAILAGGNGRLAVWDVNAAEEYHESKKP